MASPHRVVYSEVVRNEIKAHLKQATGKGRGQEALTALREIDRRLHDNPREFGDPWFSLHQSKLQIMSRILPPWCIVYGIHQEKPVVFLQSLTLYPESDFS